MSEHDWQATVLAELGIQGYGLVTPDSGTRSPSISSAAPPDVPESRPVPSDPPARPSSSGTRPAQDSWSQEPVGSDGRIGAPPLEAWHEEKAPSGRSEEHEFTRHDARAEPGPSPAAQPPGPAWEGPAQAPQGPPAPAAYPAGEDPAHAPQGPLASTDSSAWDGPEQPPQGPRPSAESPHWEVYAPPSQGPRSSAESSAPDGSPQVASGPRPPAESAWEQPAPQPPSFQPPAEPHVDEAGQRSDQAQQRSEWAPPADQTPPRSAEQSSPPADGQRADEQGPQWEDPRQAAEQGPQQVSARPGQPQHAGQAGHDQGPWQAAAQPGQARSADQGSPQDGRQGSREQGPAAGRPHEDGRSEWGPPSVDSAFNDQGAAESPYRDAAQEALYRDQAAAAPPKPDVEQEAFYPQQPAPVSPYLNPEQPVPEPPDQRSGWDQASEASWDQVAQSSWGPPPDDADTAAHVQPQAPQQPHQQPHPQAGPPGADAWQQEPQGRHAAPPRQPGAPTPPSQPPSGPMGPRDLVRKAAHGDPLMRRMSRGVRRTLGAAAADEVRRTADVENILGRAVPSLRQIAVTSIRGGAGKTTVAGLTATVIAQYRQDRVLAIDADSGLGSLPLRLGVGSDRSLHDLSASRPRTFDEATRFLARTAGGLWVLSGTSGGRINRELDLATFQAAASDMSRYFAAAVIDCGAGLLPELQRGILADAHSQVMVTPGTVDGAISARGALEWQATHGYEHLLTRTVIAFVTHTPHVDADLSRAGQMLSAGGMPVVHLPYDRHLATGTAIESARIGQETRAAAIRVAIEAFDRATSV